jgi:hypothetical protein
MDSLVPVIAIVTSFVAAVLGAFFGSIVGPAMNARYARAGDQSAFIRDQRREAYVAFTLEVEKTQRLADAVTYGLPSTSFSLTDLDDLEFARVNIDLFGSHLARVWAYRCTLAFIALEQVTGAAEAEPAQRDLHRAKLHEARAHLVRVIRVELGVSRITGDDPTSLQEISDQTAEEAASRGRVTRREHENWLTTPPGDATALPVTAELKTLYEQEAGRAMRTAAGQQEHEEN